MNKKTQRDLLIAFVICLIIFAISFMMIFLVQAQNEVTFETTFKTVQGENGLWYIQCLEGCGEFYDVAPIDILYSPQPTDWQAMNEFKRLEADYLGLVYVPLPPPMNP